MNPRLLGVAISLWLGACSSLVPRPDAGEVPSAEPLASWARVLEHFVDDQGRVNFAALTEQREDLDRYVAWVYDNGPATQPQQYPTPQHVLAYHLNAYNALAMFNVIEAGIPETNAGFNKVGFFFLRKLRVAGQEMSLYDYENELIRKLGDPRVHFALNCMSVSCPRLPREPFAAQTLEAQLDREARYFFSEPRNFSVDEAAHTVFLSEIMDFYPDDFLAKAPSLLAYANRYRAAPAPDSYQVRFRPYDWAINRQP